MAKRPPIKVHPVPDVHGWFRWKEVKSGLSATMLATAVIASFRALSESEQEAMIQWAKLLDDERISWADFERVCTLDEAERVKALERQVERVLADRVALDRAAVDRKRRR